MNTKSNSAITPAAMPIVIMPQYLSGPGRSGSVRPLSGNAVQRCYGKEDLFAASRATAPGRKRLNGIVMPDEIKATTENRKALTGVYKELLEEISSILFRHDPIGINFEENTDEYDAEAGTILPRLRRDMTDEEATAIVHEEFVRWFSRADAGPEGKYAAIAAEILAAYRQHGLR